MKYYLIDADNKTLGRIATQAAIVLSGKVRTDYDPRLRRGDSVIIINCDGVKVSGKKSRDKIYHRFSGYPGGIKSFSFETLLKKDSCKVVRDAISGMLPKNKLRKDMLKRLFTYKDDAHKHKLVKDISEIRNNV